MRSERLFSWSDRLVRRSVLALIALAVVAILIGFVWLPSVHADFTAQGLWASICRAAGAPADWSGTTAPAGAAPPATNVVLDRGMAHIGDNASIGRGATLALNCTMCHGAQGISTSDAPNLAGQYPEVILKQLEDFQAGNRASPIMQAMAKPLTPQNIHDLAAYYASLPKARTAPTTYDESLPALVRVGAPLRNIAPCVSCHGGIDQKLGAPWIEGMPKLYLVQQLKAFRAGTRHNDPEAVMRNVARTLTDDEIVQVANFYAGKSSPGGR